MNLPTAIQAIRPAVVQIRVEPDPEQRSASNRHLVVGSGFWAHADGLILTARHVTRAARDHIADSSGSRIAIGLAIPKMDTPVKMQASFEIASVEILEEDERHDIALLRAAVNPFASGRPSGVDSEAQEVAIYSLYGLAPLSGDPVLDGEGIAVSGYPLLEPALITTSGAIASAFGMDVQELPHPDTPGRSVQGTADSYLADVAVNPGNSGGPVYRLSDGSIVGVCVAFMIGSGLDSQQSPFFYNSGLSVVVPIKYGLELLFRHTSPAAE